MKRYGDLWSQFISWENLCLAARKARRGKRRRPVVVRFEFDREAELFKLQRELAAGCYQPGPFTTHWIRRPKLRLISAAPYRDRVVHHALMKVLEPILDRHFHPDSFACRRGKGTHAAATRLQHLLARFRYTLQCDICKFFPSIDHAILKELFRRRLKDRRLLNIMDRIVDGSNEQEGVREWFAGDDLFAPAWRRRGLPIGNLTSQWFANWYLDAFDHAVTTHWKFGYVRYCDDFILLHNDRARLVDARQFCQDWLNQQRLRVHQEKLAVLPAAAGRTFVGFRIWARHRSLRAANIRSFRRRLAWMKRAFAAGHLPTSDIRVRLMSWLGHARQADSYRLIRRLSRGWRFQRMNCRAPVH